MTSDLTSDLSGNTIPAAKSFKIQARQFILTVNEISLGFIDNIIYYLEHFKQCNYILVAEHIGQENKHYHIYVQYTNTVKLSNEYLGGSHIEKAFGTPQQNYNYVMALDDKHKSINVTSKVIYENGIIRKTGSFKSIKELETLPIEELKDLPIQYYRVANDIINKKKEEEELQNLLSEIENEELKAPEVIYLTGPSGSGKTYSAYKIALSKYMKEDIGKININNNFFKIVNDKAKCYIVEEFRASQLHASEFLQFLDKYGYNANVKGTFQYLRPECIIICSIINPFNLYNDEINEQFIRRISICYELDKDHKLIPYNLNKDDELIRKEIDELEI